jgi:hypothetical protein
MSGHDYINPLVILAPEKSRAGAICAMLGRHPEMCALLDTRLFARNEMQEWIEAFGKGPSSRGLLQCVAEIVFDGHSKQSLERARRWLLKRANRSTIDVFTELAAMLYPLLIVERTAIITCQSQHMCRIRRHYPEAKFLHVVLHPAESGRLLIEHFEKCYQKKSNRTLEGISNPESAFYNLIDFSAGAPEIHPYQGWHERHTQILRFLSSVSKDRQMRIRAEDFLANPESGLKKIIEWLGLRNDEGALNSMTTRRPAGDGYFSADRLPRSRQAWPTDPPPEVKELAWGFGYLE